jgi:butyrate kinase
MALKIFVINPGSTSTKVALYDGGSCAFERVIRHDSGELGKFPTAASQLEYRFASMMEAVLSGGVRLETVDAFAGRGGLLRPLKGGTYVVNNLMLDDLRSSKYGDHASNLGAVIASELAVKFGKEAYVVNPPVVDEMMDEARFTGLPQMKRRSAFHALNQKAAAMRAAKEAGMDYSRGRFIVAHLGGGISVGAHELGRVVDVNDALEEGPFSPERAGSLPARQLVELCFSGRYSRDEINRMLVGKGGLFAYTGTTDCRKIEADAARDENVKQLLDAMIYKISREICANAAALCGEIDRIVITGGLAYSSYIIEGIKRRVSFLGQLVVYPGEDEMAALADGTARVLDGREKAMEY